MDLKSFLPTATVMVITVTATTTNGRPLSEEEMMKVDEACEMALKLDAAKRTVSSSLKLFTFLMTNSSLDRSLNMLNHAWDSLHQICLR